MLPLNDANSISASALLLFLVFLPHPSLMAGKRHMWPTCVLSKGMARVRARAGEVRWRRLVAFGDCFMTKGADTCPSTEFYKAWR